jgi:hypothetical protein
MKTATEKVPMTKNRLFNLTSNIMGKMCDNSKDEKEFLFKLAGLYGQVQKEIPNFFIQSK